MRHRQLTLVRHGTLAAELTGCYIGRLDVPLSSAGQTRAMQLAERLAARDIDGLWCSPALRARQTAAPLARLLAQPCTIKEALREVDFGRWEGLTFEQIRAGDPLRVQQWADHTDDFSFPDGESQRQFQQRLLELAAAIHHSRHSHLALVTHGGVIRTLLCLMLGWPPRDSLKFSVDRGGYATLNLYGRQAVLTGIYNEF